MHYLYDNPSITDRSYVCHYYLVSNFQVYHYIKNANQKTRRLPSVIFGVKNESEVNSKSYKCTYRSLHGMNTMFKNEISIQIGLCMRFLWQFVSNSDDVSNHDNSQRAEKRAYFNELQSSSSLNSEIIIGLSPSKILSARTLPQIEHSSGRRVRVFDKASSVNTAAVSKSPILA